MAMKSGSISEMRNAYRILV